MLGVWISSAPAAAPDAKPPAEKFKEIAGTAEVLRGVPKHFAVLKAVDAARHRVTLLMEGESLPRVWTLLPDAEVKVFGWWGRLSDLRVGQRVWVWLHTDRQKQPVAIAMIADELSEQDIHGPGVGLEARDATSLTLKPVKGPNRTLKTEKAEVYRGKDRGALDSLAAGARIYVQSTGDQALLILDSPAFEARREEQKLALRKRWVSEGLPGAVAFLHVFGGEMDVIVDHEAIRWGRSLQPGDRITIAASPAIPGVVKQVRPWRERTLLRLVVKGADQTDLTPGQRIQLRMETPSLDVDASPLPPDLDRPRSREERIEWFLASIYCTCKVKGDGCTGHFYTLASCNPNACGMPNHMRKEVAALIDKGMTDRQIFEQLLKEHGPDLVKPHLLP
jgi:hypothetical protein